jgi:uncharacterized DUF497 family protein
MFEWDEAKRRANLKKHGVDFADLEEFDWDGAVVWTDDTENYGEERFKALAVFRGRIHFVVFTMRGASTRIISFRKAEKREIRKYEKEKDV